MAETSPAPRSFAASTTIGEEDHRAEVAALMRGPLFGEAAEGGGGGNPRATLSSFAAAATLSGSEPATGTLSGAPAGGTLSGAPVGGTLSGAAASGTLSGAPAGGTLSGYAAAAGGAAEPGTGSIAGEASDFSTLHELGRGGMGVVYVAQQRSLSRPVAVKALLPHLAQGPVAAKFATEARIMGRLEHPGIPPVHAFGTDPEGRAFLAMKLVKGTGWDRLLHPRTPEEEARAAAVPLRGHVDILKRVCEATAFAHSKGLIHRDLKPENIMIGEFGEVLVMDWGIAFDVATRPAAPPAGPRSPVGTPAYLAPEMARCREDLFGPWTDVYLLGGILYEVLAGSPPHDAPGVIQALMKAKDGKVEPPRIRAPGEAIPDALADIAMKALDPAPEGRYQTAKELAQAIELYLDHEASIELAAAALDDLIKAERAIAAGGNEASTAIYGRLAAAVSSLKQALGMYEGNKAAREGLTRARIVFAGYAVDTGDLALAEAELSELPAEDPHVAQIRGRIAAVRAERAREARRRKRLIALAAFAVVAAVVAGGIAIRAAFSIYRRNLANRELGSMEYNESPAARMELFGRAVEVDPTFDQGHYGLGIAYLDQADQLEHDPAGARALRERARAAFDRAIELGVGARGYFQRGYAKEYLDDYDGARADHQKAFELDPDGAFGLQSGTALAIFDRRYGEAIERGRRSLEKNPELDLSCYRRGLAYFALGDGEKAVAEFERAHELWPCYEYAMSVADAHVLRDDWALAGKWLLLAHELSPQQPQVLARLGRAALQAGDVERARRVTEAGVAAATGSLAVYEGVARHARARVLRASGDVDGALAELERATSGTGVSFGYVSLLPAFLERAEILLGRGSPTDIAKALAAFDPLAEAAPDRPDVRAFARELVAAAGRTGATVPANVARAAASAGGAGRELGPRELLDAAERAFFRGSYDRVEALVGRVERTIPPGTLPLETGTELDPAAGALVVRVRIAIARGKLDLARALLDVGIARRFLPAVAGPGRLEAAARALGILHGWRAVVSTRRGDAEGATRDAARAFALGDRSPHVLRERARGRLRAEAYDAALSDLGRALRADPLDVEALLLRADAYTALEDEESAAADRKLAAALSGTPDAPEK